MISVKSSVRKKYFFFIIMTTTAICKITTSQIPKEPQNIMYNIICNYYLKIKVAGLLFFVPYFIRIHL